MRMIEATFARFFNGRFSTLGTPPPRLLNSDKLGVELFNDFAKK